MPMSRAQQAMAAKPTLREIERAHAMQLDAWAHQDAKRLCDPFQFRGWEIRLYESWITAGWVYVCADAQPGADGRPGAQDSAEFATQDEARAWVRALSDMRLTPQLPSRGSLAA